MSGKRILITGATGGIGSAIIRRLAKEGDQLIIQGRNAELLAQLKQELEAKGCLVEPWQFDFLSLEQFDNINTLSMMKNIDVFIHVSGHPLYRMITDTSVQEWDELFNVHIKSAYLICKAILPDMVRRKWGRIVLFSSIWGNEGASCEVAYSAAKGAVNAFTKALAKELAPSNITVNAIAPGLIETNMVTQYLSQTELNQLKEQIPSGRLGTPEEVAALTSFLAGEESAYITGQILTINGGW